MARINANLSDITEDDMEQSGGGWKAWPEGWYRLVLDKSVYKPTKKGDGKFLDLDFLCLDQGPQFQKSIRDFLVLEHPNETTRHIARVKLKALAIAAGHPTPDQVDDSEELHRKPLMARIYQQKADDPQYGDADGMQNKIAEYLSVAEYRAKHGNGAAPAVPQGDAGPPGDEPPPIADDDIPF